MATRTISNAGGNWNSTGTWVEGVVAVTGDTVVATPTSGNLTVNVGAGCTILNLTGYNGLMVFNSTLTVAGNITLSPTMTIGGNSSLLQSATGTLTSNGKSLGSVSLGLQTANVARTFADNWTVNNLSISISAPVNGSTVYVNGNFTNTSNVSSGTTIIEMIGTGTISTGTGTIRNQLRINTSGTITFAAANINLANNLLYQSGTVVTTGNTVTMSGACTLNVSGDSSPSATTTSSTGVNFNNLVTTAAVTHTVTGNIRICGTHTYGGSNFGAGKNIYNNGSVTVTSNTGGVLTNYYMDGTGAITTSSGSFRNNLILNTTGTITITTLSFGGVANQTLTYIPNTGTVNAGTLLLGNLGIATTVDTNVLNFGTVQFQGSVTTITLNSILNCTNCNFIVGATLAGTAGINTVNLTCTVAGTIITLKNGVTYNVSSNLTLTGTNASRIQLKSSTTSSYSFFNLNSGSTCYVSYVNATDIDSSGGRLITDVKGTLLRTINWYVNNPDYFAFF